MSYDFDLPRKTRVQESRGNIERSKGERPKMTQWQPANMLSMPQFEGDGVGRWIAEYAGGEYLDRSVDSAFEEGYEPVMEDTLVRNRFGRKSNDGCVRSGGLILMKMPREFAQQRRAYYAEQSAMGKRSVDRLQGVESDNRIPSFSNDQSRVLGGLELLQSISERGK